NTSGDLVTAGGSGFGIMALIVGIERGFITRDQGLQRLDRILDFLETADRFHGAWPHWMNGNTGKVIPFSPNDNGADLVETAFLIQGLITFRQYLNPVEPAEQDFINRINQLWQAVEWDWFRRSNQNTLYWHWSPDKQWTMNMQIKGWNESLIVYTLAAASPTHTIPKPVYDNGWASNGNMRNGNTYEGIQLPLGPAYGGPLFFAHYSFLGLDPRGLGDAWCSDYFLQNRNHSLINRKYCIRNPQRFVGYSGDNWGLTASDNHMGYSAHSPTNDLGVISPTAALSSFPYTPDESMLALKFFYYTLGDRLWGTYGFYDAFNITQNWTASSYLAIDQGPIIVMIENHRTGLLWDLFMSAPEVQSGLTKLGFNF
ncbi:MAG: glucoamylase family protein, partial [Cyclobacteriaceae bacterium]